MQASDHMVGGYFYQQYRLYGKNIEMKIAEVEPTPKCKHSAVALGATLIGSAGRAPDKYTENKNKTI
jgi:hypothetical protein